MEMRRYEFFLVLFFSFHVGSLDDKENSLLHCICGIGSLIFWPDSQGYLRRLD